MLTGEELPSQPALIGNRTVGSFNTPTLGQQLEALGCHKSKELIWTGLAKSKEGKEEMSWGTWQGHLFSKCLRRVAKRFFIVKFKARKLADAFEKKLSLIAFITYTLQFATVLLLHLPFLFTSDCTTDVICLDWKAFEFVAPGLV